MINLRYHIVSITAVFLALGIGLTLGSTFLDRVTVDTLKNQLDNVQARVDETESENESLAARVDGLEDRDRELAAELPERLMDGHLADVPVLVVATEGTDASLVEQAVVAVAGAGGDVVGTWHLTTRWELDDEQEVRALAEVLAVDTDDVERLRRNGAIRLADGLLDAIEPDPVDDAAAGVGSDVGTEGEATPPGAAEADAPAADTPTAQDPDEGVQPEPPPASEPEVAAALEEAGFLDYQPAPGGGGGRVLLPSEGLRVIVLSGSPPDAGQQRIAHALLDELTADGPVPVVAAQGEVDLLDGEGDPASESARRTTFVGPLREGELTRDRLSTLDDLDRAAGVAALVLSLTDAGDLRLGHYGVAPGASRLLPGTDPEA